MHDLDIKHWLANEQIGFWSGYPTISHVLFVIMYIHHSFLLLGLSIKSSLTFSSFFFPFLGLLLYFLLFQNLFYFVHTFYEEDYKWLCIHILYKAKGKRDVLNLEQVIHIILLSYPSLLVLIRFDPIRFDSEWSRRRSCSILWPFTIEGVVWLFQGLRFVYSKNKLAPLPVEW